MKIWRTMILVVVAVAATAALADDPETFEANVNAGRWGSELSLGANLLQSYYTENWNGGDTGSIVWNATLDARATKQVASSWRWLNTLNLAFGQNHQQERQDGQTVWRKPDKSTDQVNAETIMRNTTSALGPFVGVRFQSRFLDQTDPRGDLPFNPLELFETVGISHGFVDTEQQKFFLRLGATAHQMWRDIYLDDFVPGDDPVNQDGSDWGVELVLNYVNTKLAANVEYESQLRFYQPFHYSGKGGIDDLGAAYLESVGLPTDLGDYTTVMDIDWENNFKANITKVINVQFYVRWVYDKYDNTVTPVIVDGEMHNIASVGGSVRKAGQFKQTLSLGFGYTF